MTTLHPVPDLEGTQPPQSRIARFGIFELDVVSGELRRAGVRVPLQDQPARLLALLLEHPGEVVTRDELRTRLWPAEFVDFDHSLNTAIRKLRAALDDSADNPRFVETLARRGYRFIAPVVWSGEQQPPAIAPPKKRGMLPLVLGIIAIFAVVVAAALLLVKRNAVTATAKSVDSIAVLPFVNNDPETQHVSDGLTEILIDTLSRLPKLRVMAPTTVFRYKDKGLDPRTAGKELAVEAIVTGQVRRSADQYAVRVELIDARDGAQLWAGRFETTTSDLPAAQRRIAAALSQRLRQGVGGSGLVTLTGRYATTPEAYELYTRGLYAWNQRDRNNLNRALQYFGEAAERDPNFAAAYSGLANTYGVMVGYGWIPVPEGTTKIIANAQRALDLDPDNAEALVSLATTKFRNVWDFAGADADYRRALAINPNYATGHQWYADLLYTMGRWEDARREIDLAYEIDPFAPPINAMWCFSFYRERRYSEAIASSRRAAEIDPRLGAPFCVMNTFLAMGDLESAMTEMRTAQKPPFHNVRAQLFDAYQRGGREAFYRALAKGLENSRKPDDDHPVGIAMAYAQIGERDVAFQWLERGYETRISQLTNINTDPLFDPLRADPRWSDLLRRIGIPDVRPPS